MEKDYTDHLLRSLLMGKIMKFESTINEISEVEAMQYFFEKHKITVQYLCLLLICKLLEQKVHMSMSNFFQQMDLTSRSTQLVKTIHTLKHEDLLRLVRKYREMKKEKKSDILLT